MATSLVGLQAPAFAYSEPAPTIGWINAWKPIPNYAKVSDSNYADLTGNLGINSTELPSGMCGSDSNGYPRESIYSFTLINVNTGVEQWIRNPWTTYSNRSYYPRALVYDLYPSSKWVAHGYLNCDSIPIEELDKSKWDITTQTLTIEMDKISVVDRGIVVDSNPNYDTVRVWAKLSAPTSRWSAYGINNLGDSDQEVQWIPYCSFSPNVYLPADTIGCSINNDQYESIAFAFGKTPWELGAVTQWPPVGVDIKDTFLITPTDIVTREIEQRSEKAGLSPTEMNPCAATCTTGDPVSVSNGNFYDTQVDASIKGRIGLESSRNYSVLSRDFVGMFGKGWAGSYGMRVDASGDNALVTEENGGQIDFKAADGVFSPEYEEVKASLTKSGDEFTFQRWGDDIKYHFDLSGKLTRISYGSDSVNLTYGVDGKLSKVSEQDRSITFAWSGSRVSSTTDHTGRVFDYEYNTDNRLVKVITPGHVSDTYEYDNKGRITQFTNDLGGVTENIYDDLDRVIEQSLPDGDIIKLKFEQNPRIPSITSTTIDGGPEDKWKYEFMSGRLTKKYDPSGNAHSSLSYDSLGRLLMIINADSSKSVMIGYDDKNHITRQTRMIDGVTSFTSYSASHKLTESIASDGIKTVVDYDVNDFVESKAISSPDGTLMQNTSYERADSSHSGDVTSITNPLGGITTIGYTANGEAEEVVSPSGNKQTSEFDSLGRLIKSVSPEGNADPLKKLDFTTTYEFDESDNQVGTISSAGSESSTYNNIGNPAIVTNALGKVSSTEYDSAGRVTKEIKPDGEFESFSYSKEVDPTYGVNNKVKAWTNSVSGLTTTYKTNSSSINTVISSDGTTIVNRAFGEYMNQHSARYVDGVFNMENTTYSNYAGTTQTNRGVDGQSQSSTYDFDGRKTQDSGGGILQNYTYDGLGRLIKIESGDRSREYTYDIAGNVTSTKYPDGSVVDSKFNSSGQQIQATDWSGRNFDFDYNASGQIESMSSDSGLGFNQTFDKDQLTSKVWRDSTGTEVSKFDSTFNAGQIVADSKKVGSSPAANRSFEFNNNGQITKSNDDPFSWAGNQVASTDKLKSLSYDANGRLDSTIDQADATTDYSYDNQGQRTKAGAIDYGWSGLGYLTSVGSTTYGYDGAGVRATINGAQQVYDQNFKLMSNGDTKYLWSPDGSLLEQDSMTVSSPLFAVTDAAGSVYGLFGANAAADSLELKSEYSYSVFGERNLVGGADLTVIGYDSEQLDESGLIYLRARYYDPATAQFVSIDPALSMTLDAFGFTSGNPLQMIDPLGLWSWSDTANAIAIVSAVLLVTALIVGTGGLAVGPLVVSGAAIMSAATVTGVAATSITAATTVREFSQNGASESFWWGVGGIAIGVAPFVRPLSSIGKLAKTAPPSSREISSLVANAKIANAKVATGATGVIGTSEGLLGSWAAIQC